MTTETEQAVKRYVIVGTDRGDMTFVFELPGERSMCTCGGTDHAVKAARIARALNRDQRCVGDVDTPDVAMVSAQVQPSGLPAKSAGRVSGELT